MGRPALRAVASRDPLRAALADAIEKLGERRAAHLDAVKAQTRLDDQLSAFYAELDEIDEAIARARAGQRDEIMASVMRGDATPGNSKLAEAEMRKADAEARREAIREAQAVLRTEVEQHADWVRSAEANVKGAIGEILWEALPDIIEAARPVRTRLAQLARIVTLIEGNSPGIGAMDYNDPRRGHMHEAQRLLAPILSEDARLPPADIGAWREAAESLKTDPDAALPTEG